MVLHEKSIASSHSDLKSSSSKKESSLNSKFNRKANTKKKRHKQNADRTPKHIAGISTSSSSSTEKSGTSSLKYKPPDKKHYFANVLPKKKGGRKTNLKTDITEVVDSSSGSDEPNQSNSVLTATPVEFVPPPITIEVHRNSKCISSLRSRIIAMHS